MTCPHCGGRMRPIAFSEMYRCIDCGAESLDYDDEYDDWGEGGWTTW